jgi:DNA-binding FadR family transcriptional regulator
MASSASAQASATVCEPTPEVLVEGRSAAVSRLLNSEKGIRDFQETRMVFEAALARRAALKARTDEIERIWQALEANRLAPDLPAFQSTDVAFHLSIAEVAGNRNFVAMNDALLEWLVQ